MTERPTITAYRWVPDFARGHVRDIRARWAFEETGQPYDVEVITLAEAKKPAHRRCQPFGQVPTYRQGAIELFESGAIALHIARAAPGLLPDDAAARASAEAWVIAALNSVEPIVMQLAACDLFEADKPWSAMRRPGVVDQIRGRLAELSARLGDDDWLTGDFSVGDLMMICVLREVQQSGLLNEFPNLRAYVERGMARPAFQRALAAQMEDFADD